MMAMRNGYSSNILKTCVSGIALGLAVMLSGCANTVSQTPGVSKAELAAEQAEQRRILEAEKSQIKSEASAQDRPAMLQRLEVIGGKVSAAGLIICRDLGLKAGECSFPYALDKGEEVNAYTDGTKIVITPAMMKFAKDDTQLATVLSHEFAHAIMKHTNKTQQNATIGGLLGMAVDTLARTQGFDTGSTFSNLGAQGAVMRYSQGFEREADYIGMYILERAGYDITQAATLWRRMATVNPDGIYNGSTHPTTAERYVLLSKTAQEIADKKQRGVAVLPENKPKDDSIL